MVEIVRTSAHWENAFLRFLIDINTEKIRAAFAPHPFTPEEAHRVCHYRGKDEYYVAVLNDRVVGYGMLRGWDEGYTVPSLGICIHPDFQRRNFGQALMNHLIAAAEARGAEELMLKVNKDNVSAIELYRKLGFQFSDLDASYLKGIRPLK